MEEPGAEQVLQVLCIFQTFEGMNYILHLFVAQPGSLGKGKELYCLGNAVKKTF